MGRAMLWLGLLLVAGCARSSTADETAIRQIVELRRQAIIARDPVRYRQFISPAYDDHGQDARAKLAELTSSLLSQQIIDFHTDDLRITVSGNQATLRDRYRLQLVSKGVRYDLQGEETIRLRKEADGWKISGGL